MNTNVLSKCVDELKKDTPNIQYVLGMLETIIEMSGGTRPVDIKSSVVKVPVASVVKADEEEFNEVLDKYVGGKTGQLN